MVHISLCETLLLKKERKRRKQHLCCDFCRDVLNARGIKCTFDFEVIRAFNLALCVGPILSGVPTVNVVNKPDAAELL